VPRYDEAFDVDKEDIIAGPSFPNPFRIGSRLLQRSCIEYPPDSIAAGIEV